MTPQTKIGVLLKGGLGNQLFQISAGLYCNRGEPLEVFNNFTLPRQTDGVADALHFEWQQDVIVNNVRSNRIERKALSLSLKRGLARKSIVRIPNFLQPAKIFVDSVVSIRFKSCTRVYSGEGVGFCEFRLKPGLNLLNGYFQAHQFAFHSAVRTRLKEISLKQISPGLTQWIEKAKIETPIIVHLRLGDYKNESGIGLLSPSYYEEALRTLELKEKSRNIWIFTDEVGLVDKYVSPPSTFHVSIIGEIGLNPAETLELMRYGSAYVIANSTFSWWAAFLSYQSGCTTIMPSPWFRNMPSPIGIKPQDWIEIEFLKH